MQLITLNVLASDNNNGKELSNNYRSNLAKNLASFGLTADLVSGDGDCVFSSIVRQLKRLSQSIDETESSLAAHLASLGLDEGAGGGGRGRCVHFKATFCQSCTE